MKTVKATFIRTSESGKSAMIAVPSNGFQLGNKLAYISAIPCEGLVKGDTLEIPSGYRFQEMVNSNGEVLTYADGNPLVQLVW